MVYTHTQETRPPTGKKRIVILPSWYPKDNGGFFGDQARTMSENGYDVHLIIVEETSLKKITIKNIVALFRYNENYENGLLVWTIKQWRIPKSERVNVHIWSYLVRVMFKFYLKKYGKPDIIHVQSGLWAGYPAHNPLCT
jgi:hypothetical protein